MQCSHIHFARRSYCLPTCHVCIVLELPYHGLVHVPKQVIFLSVNMLCPNLPVVSFHLTSFVAIGYQCQLFQLFVLLVVLFFVECCVFPTLNSIAAMESDSYVLLIYWYRTETISSPQRSLPRFFCISPAYNKKYHTIN